MFVDMTEVNRRVEDHRKDHPEDFTLREMWIHEDGTGRGYLQPRY